MKKNLLKNSKRLISELPISPCFPIDGNIVHLEIPPVKILSNLKYVDNKSKK